MKKNQWMKNYLVGAFLFVLPVVAFAANDQISMDVVTTSDLHVQKLNIYVQDEQGQMDLTFNGMYAVKIDIDEVGGAQPKSYESFPEKLKFVAGQSELKVRNSEGERLDLKIQIEKVRFPGYVSLSFQGEDKTSPEITSVDVDKKRTIVLGFSEEIAKEEAIKPENFLMVTNTRKVAPIKVDYNKTYLMLHFADDFDPKEKGYIRIRHIKDLKGNEIIYDSHSPEFVGDCGCSG